MLVNIFIYLYFFQNFSKTSEVFDEDCEAHL